MRIIYTILFYLVLPFAFMRLWWRSRRQPAYRQRWRERLGQYPFTLAHCLWVHAVSVGEVMGAAPLIRQLLADYPGLPILVTTMTPTGSAQVKTLFGDTVHHAYLPYDVPGAVRRFLAAMKPKAGVILETELWPNLIAICHEQHIPLCLINARLSQRSLQGYQYVGGFARTIIRQLACIATHGEKDAERFIQLGADPATVYATGSIKFDLHIPDGLEQQGKALRQQLGVDRFIWIAASTHEGEEQIILAAHTALRNTFPDALLILVPRHPDRFEAVNKLCAANFTVCRRSQPAESCTPKTAVYLGDAMGELMVMYAAADAAFVGGSLVAHGGHNMLEPAALAKPVITGQHTFNFAEINELFKQADASILVLDEQALATVLIKLASDTSYRQLMGLRAQALVEKNRGALDKQLELIKHCIRRE